jgi:acetyltransferase-like isoleucine patch superfamily enzyme
MLKNVKDLLRLLMRFPHRPPVKARFGRNSVIKHPRRLDSPKGLKLGDHVTILEHAWLGCIERYAGKAYEPRIVVGSDTSIGRYACITAINSIEIGKRCLISEHVYISDHGHGTDPSAGPPRLQPLFSKGPVEIGDESFIGYRVSILPGVILGRNCVVGAHSVVTRSFPDYSVVAGVPAKLIYQQTPPSKLAEQPEDIA